MNKYTDKFQALRDRKAKLPPGPKTKAEIAAEVAKALSPSKPKPKSRFLQGFDETFIEIFRQRMEEMRNAPRSRPTHE